MTQRAASASVTEFLHSQFENLEWWNYGVKYCGIGPFHHDVWRIYRAGMIKQCLNSSSFNAGYISVLRNPVDRLVSQLLFFEQALKKQLERKSFDQVLAVYRDLLFSPKNVTAESLQTLLHGMRSLASPTYLTNPYELVLSKSELQAGFRPSNRGLMQALKNLNSDIMAVGTTESLPTFFVLLSRLFGRNITNVINLVRFSSSHNNKSWTLRAMEESARYGRWEGGPLDEEQQVEWQSFNLTEACHLHLLHGFSDAFPVLRRFGTPSAEKLLSASALALLRQEVSNDIKIWRRAAELHKQQLRAVGLSQEEAMRVWQEACRGVPRVRTQAELRKYRHIMKGTHRKNPLTTLLAKYETTQQRQRAAHGIPSEGWGSRVKEPPRTASKTKQRLHYHQQGVVGQRGKGW